MDLTTPQFLDQNATRAYPVASACSRVASDGQRLPDSLIVGAIINAIPSTSFGTFHVTEVVLSPSLASVTLSRKLDGILSEVAVVTATLATHVRNTAYPFSGGPGAPDVRGVLILGDLEHAAGEAAGILAFDPDNARFEVSAIHWSKTYIPSVSLLEAGIETAVMTGNIRLVPGRNILLTVESDGGIRIDAISGENMSACGDQAPCIRTISGVAPDDSGALVLQGTECVSVTPDVPGHSIAIANECSTPCCGCTEQAGLATALSELNLQYNAVRDLAYRLASESASMVANLVGHLSNG